MEGITYKIGSYFGKAVVIMDDPIFSRVWYLKSVRNGWYSWTQNTLFAKAVSAKTALNHVKALEAGADKCWYKMHDDWKNNLDRINAKKEEA